MRHVCLIDLTPPNTHATLVTCRWQLLCCKLAQHIDDGVCDSAKQAPYHALREAHVPPLLLLRWSLPARGGGAPQLILRLLLLPLVTQHQAA